VTVPQTESVTLPVTLEPDNPLWRYALACWQQPELAKACLDLQVQGWSVTRILCAGWLGANGRLFTGVEDATVTEWRDRVTGRIRSARKSIPRHHDGSHDLRDSLAKSELKAEQTELALAWQTLNELNPEAGSMLECTNIIVQNLLAAAPPRKREPQLMTHIEDLARLLARSHTGSPLPC